MKLNLMIALVVTVVFSGCVSVQEPIAHDKSFPPDGRYEILGSVTATGRQISILGIFWFGGVLYRDLGLMAQEKYKTAVDDVINVSVDKKIVSVLGIITTIDTLLRGTAIRYLPATAPAE
ncbi:MAG TPA: hypothetical protein DEQ14_04610 [Treponema sp.]|nr:hypothetical protein [Treponema sp.]